MSRAYMSFREIQYGPYVIRLMDGDEPGYAEGVPLLVSIAGPGLPGLRLTQDGPQPLTDDDGALNGVIVFGNFKGDRPALGVAFDEPPLTERYDMRIDATLKAWIKANGGDKMVRSLLRAAMEGDE